MHFATMSNAFLVGIILTLKYSKSAEVLDVNVTKGGDVLLSCFFGTNNNSITWTENNQNIVDKGSRQSDIDNQFRLYVQQISSSTIFKCEQNTTTLSNLSFPNSRNLSSFPISRSFNIKIIDTDPVKITEGQNASLTCPGRLTNVSWSNNGKTFSNSLKLTNVQRDYHLVRCNGSVNGNNSQANVKQIIKLDIQYPSENVTIRLSPNSNIVLNGTLEIVCNAEGNPVPRFFYWFMNGKSIDNTTGRLTISPLEYTDGGKYSCAPQFTQNNLTKSIFVVIKGPPSVPLDVNIISRSKNSLGISWKPPQYNGNETIDLYQVTIKSSTGELFNKANTTFLNYTVYGLQSHTTYTFTVLAMNKLFGPGSEKTLSDSTKPDDSKPTMLTVIRVNHTNVMSATWKEPEEMITGVRYFYELCEEEVNGASLECHNTSKLTWQTHPLEEYTYYFFKVRSCKDKNECSPFTAKIKKKTGPNSPERPSRLDATSLSPKELNVTWETKTLYTYHLKYGITKSNFIQDISLKKQFYVLEKLTPNTTYIVQVYAEINSENDNQIISGKAIERIFTTDAFQTITSTTTTTTKGDEVESDGLKGPLVALAVLAFIALLVASVFLFLYLRPTHDCYQLLRQRRSTSQDAFTLENVTVVSTVRDQTTRQRLTSFSSFKKHGAICKTDPIPTSAFSSHAKRLHSDSDYLFSLEFEAIGNKKYFKEEDKKIEMTYTEAKKSANKPKNRYPDISPYDHSLVVLTELDNEPDSSYINANYIDSYRKERAYIAAQGPLISTVSDFWRMIWESNSRVIVMTTNLFERSKSKCFQYWPDKESAIYGLFRITILKEEAFANYVVRSFSIQPVPKQTHYILMNDNEKSRIIHQFHYTEWPDHDVPIHSAAILRYIKKSKAANPPGAGPIVVHCSAGVGRSGTYIVIDSMMERVVDDKTVDIFNFLNHVRTQRNFLVQEEKQYSFVHDALLEYINVGDSNIPMKVFQEHVQSLKTVNPDTKRSGFDKEFEDIDYTKVTEKHKWAAKKLCNTIKNRRKDVLPVERTRVKLPPVLGTEGADYINASYMDGFSRKKEYIATQAPMHTTVESFWRMVWTTKSSILVMLLDDEECKKDDYFADLPTAEEGVTCGKFEIQLEAEEHVSDHVTVRKLRLLSTTDSSDGHTITHYHYHHWPSNGFPDDKTSVISLLEDVRNQKITENEEAPITVYCDFGVGRSGVFCLLSTLFDQLEKEQSVDVYQTAKLYRLQRPKLIETKEQYKFCYDILNLLVAAKLGSSPTQTASDSGNGMPDVSDTEGPEKSGTDNPETSGIDSPDKSSTDSPNVPGTNDADFAESKDPLLSHNDEQEADSEGSKTVDESNDDDVKGDAIL